MLRFFLPFLGKKRRILLFLKKTRKLRKNLGKSEDLPRKKRWFEVFDIHFTELIYKCYETFVTRKWLYSGNLRDLKPSQRYL